MHCTSLSSGNQVDGSPLAISRGRSPRAGIHICLHPIAQGYYRQSAYAGSRMSGRMPLGMLEAREDEVRAAQALRVSRAGTRLTVHRAP